MEKIQLTNKFDRDDFEASIGENTTFWSYINSYRNALKILLEDFDKSGKDINKTAFPILFMTRHCIELGLKDNIRYFSKYSKKDDYTNSDSHNLKNLLGGFKLHIDETINQLKSENSITIDQDDKIEFDKYYLEVEKLINIFDHLDKGSFSFRYPIDTKKQKVFDENEKINVFDVVNLFEKSMILIEYTADLLGKYTDFNDELNQEYEEIMRDNII